MARTIKKKIIISFTIILLNILLVIIVFAFIYLMIKMIITNRNLINDISISLITLIPIIFLILSHYYSYNEENLIWHCCFFQKNIPIYSIIEIRYYFLGSFLVTFSSNSLMIKNTILIILFCSKKCSLRKMNDFFNIMKKKNMSHIIKL